MPLYEAMNIVAIIFVVVGLFLTFTAHRYRSENAPPYLSLHPKHAQPIWKRRDRFVSASGYGLHVLGAALCAAGGLILLITRFLR
jgi:hypothetical protein